MRSPLLLGVLSALILAAVAVTVWYLGKATPEVPLPEVPEEEVALPRDSGALLVLTSKTGQIITVPDFTYTHPSLEVEQSGITYVYVTQDDDLKEADPYYSIVYGSNSSILIFLLAEPLTTARARAEEKLKEFIPIPEDVLCSLKVSVKTTDTINPMYAGKELGLSFCPGAVALP